MSLWSSSNGGHGDEDKVIGGQLGEGEGGGGGGGGEGGGEGAIGTKGGRERESG